MRDKRPDRATLVEGLQALRLEALAQAEEYADMIATLERANSAPTGGRKRANTVRLSDALEPRRRRTYTLSAAGRAAIVRTSKKRWREAKRKKGE